MQKATQTQVVEKITEDLDKTWVIWVEYEPNRGFGEGA